jgi:hypothetical protein
MPALLRVALDRRMVTLAASYLGVLPVLADVDYFLSLPSTPPWTKSQLWHCDDDAPRQLKMFIYCDDVGQDDGPLDIVAAIHSSHVRAEIKYRYAGRRYRVSDELMDRHLARDKQLSLCGPRGTTLVVDTSRCFHKGSRISTAGHHRIVAIIFYCTPVGTHLPLRLARTPGPYAKWAEPSWGEIERGVLEHPVAR